VWTKSFVTSITLATIAEEKRSLMEKKSKDRRDTARSGYNRFIRD
jgi:hypothetical protein